MTGSKLRHLLMASTGIGAFGLAGALDVSSATVADGRPYHDGVTVAQRAEQPNEVVPADRRPGKPDRSGLLGMTAEGLRDRTVYATTGEPVARIDDVVVLDDRLQLVLSVGGFLGVAAEHVALPVERFELRVDDVVLTRPISEEELEELAPYPSERATAVPSDQELSLVRTAVRPPKGARSEAREPERFAAVARPSGVLPSRAASPPITGDGAADGRRSNQ